MVPLRPYFHTFLPPSLKLLNTFAVKFAFNQVKVKIRICIFGAFQSLPAQEWLEYVNAMQGGLGPTFHDLRDVKKTQGFEQNLVRDHFVGG